jgi:hypothetical protein
MPLILSLTEVQSARIIQGLQQAAVPFVSGSKTSKVSQIIRSFLFFCDIYIRTLACQKYHCWLDCLLWIFGSVCAGSISAFDCPVLPCSNLARTHSSAFGLEKSSVGASHNLYNMWLQAPQFLAVRHSNMLPIQISEPCPSSTWHCASRFIHVTYYEDNAPKRLKPFLPPQTMRQSYQRQPLAVQGLRGR